MPVALEISPEQFLAPSGDGYAFRDPRSRALWAPGTWPETLADDAITANGVMYLAQRQSAGRQLTAHLVGSLHGHPSHWQEVLDQWGDLLRRSSIAWVEADWTPGRNPNTLNAVPEVVLPKNAKHRSFVEAQLWWARSAEVPKPKVIAPFDIDGPKEPLRNSLAPLFNLPDGVQFDLGRGVDYHPLHVFIGRTVYYAWREQMLPGMIGNIVRIVDGQGQQIDETSITLGRPHLTWLLAVLERCGVLVKTHRTQHAADARQTTEETLLAMSLRDKMINSHRLSGEEVHALGKLSAGVLLET